MGIVPNVQSVSLLSIVLNNPAAKVFPSANGNILGLTALRTVLSMGWTELLE